MFITLEGIEGAGKTTQVKHIVAYLKRKGYGCVVTREPGATHIGKKIRKILLDPESKDLDPLTELLLYMADRVQHVKEIITPALSAGKVVLCDRFFDATVVYQGYARGIDIGLINKAHELVLDGLKPDITILLDLPVEIGLSRAWEQIKTGTRNGNETRFEEETLTFHQKVRASYLKLASFEPDRFRIIDATQNEDKVRRDIIAALTGS
jgi:dTMP kinase